MDLPPPQMINAGSSPPGWLYDYNLEGSAKSQPLNLHGCLRLGILGPKGKGRSNHCMEAGGPSFFTHLKDLPPKGSDCSPKLRMASWEPKGPQAFCFGDEGHPKHQLRMWRLMPRAPIKSNQKTSPRAPRCVLFWVTCARSLRRGTQIWPYFGWLLVKFQK